MGGLVGLNSALFVGLLGGLVCFVGLVVLF